MRKIIIFLAALTIASCSRPTRPVTSLRSQGFTVECRIPTTPVKDQGQSPLCWVYGMLATIESEHISRGDSVNLSADYIARKLLEQQAQRYFFSRRSDDLSLRGMSSMLLHALQTYGAEPFDTYNRRGGVNYSVLTRKVRQVAMTSGSLRQMNDRLPDLLDREIGFMPRYVFMLGAEYTPLEFAHSVCLPGEYIALTSFTHQPFGRRFVLEVPDNQMRDSFLNVPLRQMMQTIERVLRHGHPVCWEGDISEPGFDFPGGMATLADERADASQAHRQHDFETRRTTDDHVMELCGIVRDRRGRRYFLAKNSWGTDNALHGFMLLSYRYVAMKTVAVWMDRQAFRRAQ
jgi:hypothetical protein